MRRKKNNSKKFEEREKKQKKKKLNDSDKDNTVRVWNTQRYQLNNQQAGRKKNLFFSPYTDKQIKHVRSMNIL